MHRSNRTPKSYIPSPSPSPPPPPVIVQQQVQLPDKLNTSTSTKLSTSLPTTPDAGSQLDGRGQAANARYAPYPKSTPKKRTPKKGNPSPLAKVSSDVAAPTPAKVNLSIPTKTSSEITTPISFDCRHCGRKCDDIAHLDRHKRLHWPIIPFPCPCCAFGFSDDASLWGHISAQHRGDLTPTKPSLYLEGIQLNHPHFFTSSRLLKLTIGPTCYRLHVHISALQSESTAYEKAFQAHYTPNLNPYHVIPSIEWPEKDPVLFDCLVFFIYGGVLACPEMHSPSEIQVVPTNNSGCRYGMMWCRLYVLAEELAMPALARAAGRRYAQCRSLSGSLPTAEELAYAQKARGNLLRSLWMMYVGAYLDAKFPMRLTMHQVRERLPVELVGKFEKLVEFHFRAGRERCTGGEGCLMHGMVGGLEVESAEVVKGLEAKREEEVVAGKSELGLVFGETGGEWVVGGEVGVPYSVW